MRALRIILLALAFIAFQAHAAQRNLGVKESGSAANRFALVIGNDDYKHVEPLEKAVNDARAMGKALEQAQFVTSVVVNASRTQMNTAINRFVADVAGGGIGVLFFAGHGVQVNNQNFLIPVDLQDIQSEADIADQGVSLQGVQDKLAEARAKFSLLVIDACRNNPLPKKAGRALGGTRGMAQASSAEGQMVVFSAGANQQALDKLSNSDTDPNGVFTREFLPWLTKPGVTIRDAVLQVRSSVRARAKSVNHDQFPAIYDQAEGNFYFVEGSSQVASLAPVPAPVGGGVSLDDIRKQQEARAQWDKWQAGMKADFDKIAALNAEPDLQVAAWERFLANYTYTQDNPFSAEDDQLRAQAQSRKQAAQAQQQQAAARLEQQKQEAERQQQQATQTGGTGPAMVRIPGRNYEMGKYHVTRGEFAKFVNETGYDAGNSCWVWNGSKWGERSGSNWRSPGFAQDDNHPVTCVNWHDAQAYVSWLSKKTGRQYRLPVEAEWEYACYGGSQSEYCGGGGNIDSVAWYKDNSGGQTHPVGQKQANGYGLHDMSGNLWQWMENKYDDKNDWRALRGGSWNYRLPQFVHAAIRFNDEPAKRSNHLGFRLARTLPE